MQQQGGGGGGGQVVAAVTTGDEHHQKQAGDLGFAEAASPISSRPPAATNFEELMRASTAAEAGSSSGNRWPRQETLALLQIRSEMDAAFRDVTPKAPLWEQVSRKLGELGYNRNAKKCKEKFENVQKYYKRTKEGRGGRQDGKSYKFFTQLEALHHHNPPPPTTTTTNTFPTSVQVSLLNPTSASAAISLPPSQQPIVAPSDHQHHHNVSTAAAVPLYGTNIPSSSSSSSSEGEDYGDDHDDDTEEMDIGSSGRNRKRKRSSSLGGEDSEDMRMMEFFQGLIKQVMHKQEAMQQNFLEAIERREQERMIREEARKRQDMERRAREQELVARERAISASRDAAIIAFLEKITGQTINLPTTAQVPENPQPLVQLPVTVPEPRGQHQHQPPQQPTFQQSQSEEHHQHQPDHRQLENVPSRPHLSTVIEPAPTATPEQRVVPQHQNLTVGSSGVDMTSSSRWPRTEVLALIQLRSGLESRYQEAGPKGPLWEEISAGMQRIGYNRSAKRCKEKWENINKYFKKVKESNKKRPEDAKTCPYFHELDALYKKKLLGNTSSGIIIGSLSEQDTQKQQQQQNVGGIPQMQFSMESSEDQNRGGSTELQTSTTAGAFSSSLIGEQNQGTAGAANQPEDMLKKQHQQSHGNMIDDCIKDVFPNGDNLDPENDEGKYEEIDEDDEYDDKTEEEMKMAYKIQFQRQNSSRRPSTSFMAMVQ